VPSDYKHVKPGNAFITRYLKEHSEIVFVRMRKAGRFNYPEIVGYLAPAGVVHDAQHAWVKHTEKLRQRAQKEDTLRRLGPAGDLAHDIFLKLEQPVLKRVFSEYKRVFGEKKYEYAKRRYNDWLTGKTEMSVELRERLLTFLPHHLSFEQKYDIVEAIWKRSGNFGSHYFEIDSQQGIAACLNAISVSLQAMLQRTIPENVKDTLTWLSDDSRLSEALAQKFFEREIAIRISAVREKLEGLLAKGGDQSVSVASEVRIELPTGRVTIRLTGRHRMSSQGDDRGSLVPFDKEKAVPQPVDASTTGGQFPARIEHPQDLLGEALKRLPPEKTQEIMSKAADKALEFQIKQKDAQIENAILEQRLEISTRAAQRAREAGATFNDNFERRSEDQSTRVNVRVSEEPPKRQVSGYCFVATACFGNHQHPTVVALQSFRDAVLLHSIAGRVFVATYYRVGPTLAKTLDRMPVLKPFLRKFLTKLAGQLTEQFCSAHSRDDLRAPKRS
jgi:hypothetical protein